MPSTVGVYISLGITFATDNCDYKDVLQNVPCITHIYYSCSKCGQTKPGKLGSV